MDSVIEVQRRAHEEIERLEHAASQLLANHPKTHKERLANEHKVKEYVDRIVEKSKFLHETYQDVDGSRRNAIDTLQGSGEYAEFYGRLKVVKEHHRKYPDEAVEPMELEFAVDVNRENLEAELEMVFSGEEGSGRYLDLHLLHDQYLNLKNVKKLGYLQYLAEFDNFSAIPTDTKTPGEYQKYLHGLRDYFESFFSRVQPLHDLTQAVDEAKADFDEKWEAGTFPGWEKSNGHAAGDEAESALFCVACKKQFSKQTLYDSHLKGKKHIKAAAALLKEGVTSIAADQIEAAKREAEEEIDGRRRPIAWLEALVMKYGEVLGEFRANTKEYVERKQVATDRERDLEQEAEEIEIDMSDSDDEEKIYNPLKLPLGWDGKPIPYWLYKLHGLGVEYPCEICGNYVYMGRKAFERHFQEWRHAHGMRCLGITNTKHFHEITTIADAYALWEKLKSNIKTDANRAENMEEYEDAEGNVMSKKTYLDLKRQGII